MHKKIWMAFVAMGILTAMMAAMLVGCGNKQKKNDDTFEPSKTQENTTTEPEEMVTVIVTIGESSDETMVVGGSVSELSPDVTTPGENDPTTPATGKDPTTPAKPAGPNLALTFEEYLAMTGSQQEAHFDSFGSKKAFLEWFDAAKLAWQEQNQDVEVTGPNINLDDYIKP